MRQVKRSLSKGEAYLDEDPRHSLFSLSLLLAPLLTRKVYAQVDITGTWEAEMTVNESNETRQVLSDQANKDVVLLTNRRSRFGGRPDVLGEAALDCPRWWNFT